jgi:flagellar FliJ protein
MLRNELAELRRLHQQELVVLREIEEEHETCLRRIVKMQEKGPLPLDELELQYLYLQKVFQDYKDQEARVEDLVKKIDETTGRLIEARRDKRVLEKLRDRHFEKFRYEEEYKEQLFLDEIGQSIFSRREEKVN